MLKISRSNRRRLAVLGASVAMGMIAGSPAYAVAGGTAVDHPFLARVVTGVPGEGGRSCTGTLVGPSLVLTAKSCFRTTSLTESTTVTFPDAPGGSQSVKALRLTVDPAQDLALLDLARRPVGIPWAAVATTQPAVAETLTVAGYGRTATEWVPDSAYAAQFSVQTVASGTIGIDSADAAVCMGDAGAPVLRRSTAGAVEVAAVAGASWQNGCLGAPTTTRSGAVAATTHDSTLSRSWPGGTASVDPFRQRTLTASDNGNPPVAGAKFGGAVKSGDFNGDGIADIAVGAPGDHVGGVASGSVTVFYGSATGPSVGHRLIQADFGAADEAGDRFGESLAVGDFNGDRITDLAVGAPGEAIGTVARAGAISVYHGAAGVGLTKGNGYNQGSFGWGSEADDQFGASLVAGTFSMSAIGRHADLAIGTPNETVGSSTAHSGMVMVVTGGAAELKAGWTVDQADVGGANEAGDRFGAALAAGNVFDTGTAMEAYVAELVIGAPGESPGSAPASGAVYVVPVGGSRGGGYGFSQEGNGGTNEAGDLFGAALAVGDFDGTATAFDDIAIGSPGEAPGAAPATGSITVKNGAANHNGAAFILNPSGVGITGAAGDRFGAALAARDTNGDGRGELLVGMPGYASGAGLAVLYTGQPRTSAGQVSLTRLSVVRQANVFGTDEANDGFGSAVGFGDYNKDGSPDALIGAPGEALPGEPAAGVLVTLTSLGVIRAF